MRILFQIPFPGFLRMYGSAISELAARGHRVLLAYEQPDKRRDPTAAEIEAAQGIEIVPPLPTPARRLEGQIGQVRLAADYLRYLDRQFSGALYLRRRLEKYLEGPWRILTRAPQGLPGSGALVRALVAVERLVPVDRKLEAAIAAHSPDIVLVTPLIGRTMTDRQQTDTVKAARRLGVPVGFGVSTWDQLTTKGIVKAAPDRTFVWNPIQREEATELHRLPAASVVVTGAQLFDRWFDRAPSRKRDEHLAHVGLATSRYVLYAGSSRTIAKPKHEIAFVRRWLTALRESGDPVLTELGVLVRPHPTNLERWAEQDLSELGAAVAPRTLPELPMSRSDEDLYFDSIHHSSAVVGINTTAMVESFIQRRPVLTIRAREFRSTQEGTVHFRHLASAQEGALQIAATMDEHLAQLHSALQHPEQLRPAIDGFLLLGVRPPRRVWIYPQPASSPTPSRSLPGCAERRRPRVSRPSSRCPKSSIEAMPPLLLHIGYHKSGSGWLRRLFFSNPVSGFGWVGKKSRDHPVRRLVAARPFEFDAAASRAEFEPLLAKIEAEDSHRSSRSSASRGALLRRLRQRRSPTASSRSSLKGRS